MSLFPRELLDRCKEDMERYWEWRAVRLDVAIEELAPAIEATQLIKEAIKEARELNRPAASGNTCGMEPRDEQPMAYIATRERREPVIQAR